VDGTRLGELQAASTPRLRRCLAQRCEGAGRAAEELSSCKHDERYTGSVPFGARAGTWTRVASCETVLLDAHGSRASLPPIGGFVLRNSPHRRVRRPPFSLRPL